MFELTNLALLDLRTGNFTRATAAASEVADLARETGNDYLLACNLAVLARLAGSRGDVVTSVDHARRAREIADRLADRLIGAEVAMGLAESSLAEGRPANAIAHLEDLRRLADENEVDEPSVLPFHADLVEAYARTGRESDARAELARLERQAEATGRRWALAAAARCRGYLGPADALDAHFGQALALHEAAGWSPFQRARTQLLYGERLRRARRRVDARGQLRAAIETSTSWARRGGRNALAQSSRRPVRPSRVAMRPRRRSSHRRNSRSRSRSPRAAGTERLPRHSSSARRRSSSISRGCIASSTSTRERS